LDGLDKLSEKRNLTNDELERRKELSLKMEQIWRVREIKAKQRSRARYIKEGDKNTAYFFVKANQRKRKKVIFELEKDGELITDEGMMRDHAVKFYKTLFGKENGENIRMDDDFWGRMRKYQ
jgi:hypothetical protein